jgi:hypothetical protein
MNEEVEEVRNDNPSYPLVWGFLSTSTLAAVGYLGLLFGAWPLLWLPVLVPVFALPYAKLRLHTFKGFGRFLAGYGIGLVTIMVVGTLILAALT